jgi:hypothetical protein
MKIIATAETLLLIVPDGLVDLAQGQRSARIASARNGASA